MAALQTVARLHVEQDIGDDLLQPALRTQHLLHRAPALLELSLGDIGQPLGLALEPLVNPGLRGDVLVNIPRLVAQIEHYAVAGRLIVFVGVYIRSEYLDASALVGLEQRGSGETDQRRLGQECLHCLVQLAGLGAVALVHKDKDGPLGAEVWGQTLPDLCNVGVDILVAHPLRRTEFVDQRADQPLVAGIEHLYQVSAALRAVDVLADAFEDFFNLLVQFGAVGDEQDTGSVTCSRIHFASQTMVRLLPLPWVCQMIPPS